MNILTQTLYDYLDDDYDTTAEIMETTKQWLGRGFQDPAMAIAENLKHHYMGFLTDDDVELQNVMLKATVSEIEWRLLAETYIEKVKRQTER